MFYIPVPNKPGDILRRTSSSWLCYLIQNGRNDKPLRYTFFEMNTRPPGRSRTLTLRPRYWMK